MPNNEITKDESPDAVKAPKAIQVAHKALLEKMRNADVTSLNIEHGDWQFERVLHTEVKRFESPEPGRPRARQKG